MSASRDTASDAVVIVVALLAGLAVAFLDMTADNLLLVLALLFALGFCVGWLAPRLAWLAGLSVGIVLPIAQVYVTSFDLRLPHPMHGFYYGALAVAPPVSTALVAMWMRDRFDQLRHRRRLASRTVAR